MGDDKTKWSNVIKWVMSYHQVKSYKTLNHSRVVRQENKIVQEEMDIIDGLSESIMVNLIHTLKENDVKIIR